MAYSVELSVDTSKIEAACNALPNVIAQSLSKAINQTGTRMYRAVVSDIADHLQVKESFVAQALNRRAGSKASPIYRISSVPARFPVVRWITQRDEKVCKICGPRDGKLYTTLEIRYILPAHPNCRCFTEDVDIGGELMMASRRYLQSAAQEVVDQVIADLKSSNPSSGGSTI